MAEEKINQNENIAKDEEGRVVTRNANILCVLRILEKYAEENDDFKNYYIYWNNKKKEV